MFVHRHHIIIQLCITIAIFLPVAVVAADGGLNNRNFKFGDGNATSGQPLKPKPVPASMMTFAARLLPVH